MTTSRRKQSILKLPAWRKLETLLRNKGDADNTPEELIELMYLNFRASLALTVLLIGSPLPALIIWVASIHDEKLRL